MTPSMNELTSIFTRIEANTGIVMRADYMCCQSCGHAGLAGEKQYAFYHAQDTESAGRTGQLYVAFGCEDEDDDSIRATGEAVASALREVGCEVEWDGTPNRRIVVSVNPVSFDRFNLDNIPAHAESYEAFAGVFVKTWEVDAIVNPCEYRIVYDGMVWHADRASNEAEAIDAALAVIPGLDFDVEEAEWHDA